MTAYGDYYLYEAGSEKVIIQHNNDGGAADEPAEEDFPNYPLLMHSDSPSALECSHAGRRGFGRDVEGL